MRFTYSVSTMGCKANLTDSQDIEARLQKMGGVAAHQDADVYILNTCTVTDQADRDALKHLKRVQAPLVIATGCLAEVDPLSIQKLGNVGVVRNSGKKDITGLIEDWLCGQGAARIVQGERVDWHKNVDHVIGAHGKAKSALRTRAFLKVQDGCNAFCSYCIIPLARGRSRSVSPTAIRDEINALADTGVKEVVLTAIHAADYDTGFTPLVSYLLKETRIARLRLTSLDPAEIDDELLELMQNEPRLCPHFHVSLQSGSTAVLRAMKRSYDGQQTRDCLEKIKRKVPHAFVGMDVIAGFPTESDQYFYETYELLREAPWTKMHVFPFSLRRGTAAEKIIKEGISVPSNVIKERAALLRQLSDDRFSFEKKKRVGQVVEVLTENEPIVLEDESFSVGYTRSYFRVAMRQKLPANRLVRVKVDSVGRGDLLMGVVV